MIGTPATVENRGSGTMVSPWPPSTKAWTFSTETPSSMGDEGAHARAVEDAGHAEDAVLGQARDLVGHLAHGVERVADHDQDRVRRLRERLLRALLDDLVVGVQEVVAAHPRLAGDAGGDHHHVGARGVLVVVRADHPGVGALDGGGLHDVEALALGNPLEDVDEDDVGQLPVGQALGEGRAHVARSHHRDFPVHANDLSFKARILSLARR